MSTRIPRKLDPVEVRVLGSLLEKEQTNPETVPMTVNALIAACNQKTNREPVMQLSEDQVVTALDWMRQEVLVWRSEGARTERWQQSVVRRWGLDRAAKALVTLLFLRGAQTAGELRTRSERLHPFATLEETEGALRRLAAEDEPLVVELARRPGQKETRWIHLVGDAAPEPEPVPIYAEAYEISADPSAPSRPSLASRVESLEGLVERLAADLEELKKQLGV
jgi:uncharacterized protein YceH (UPF0502 family)